MWSLILTPAVPPPGWPSSPPCLWGHRRALGTGRKREHWGMLSSSNLSATLQQPFQPLRKARRWREPPWKGGRKKGDLKYFAKGKRNIQTQCIIWGREEGQGATNKENSKLHSKREMRHLKPACSIAQAVYRAQIKAGLQETQGTSPLAYCQHCL